MLQEQLIEIMNKEKYEDVEWETVIEEVPHLSYLVENLIEIRAGEVAELDTEDRIKQLTDKRIEKKVEKIKQELSWKLEEYKEEHKYEYECIRRGRR